METIGSWHPGIGAKSNLRLRGENSVFGGLQAGFSWLGGGGPYNKDPTIFAAVLLELCRSAERGRKLLCRGVWSELCGSVCLAESVVGAAEFVEASFRTASDVEGRLFRRMAFPRGVGS